MWVEVNDKDIGFNASEKPDVYYTSTIDEDGKYV